MTADVAAELRSWLTSYGEKPSLGLLLTVAENLCTAEDAGAAAEAAGISREWLRTQGEMIARMSVQDVREAVGWTVQELRRLRVALSVLAVPCIGWAVSDDEIARSLLRYARELYQRAVSRMDPHDGWELLRLQAAGCVPSLSALAPGASDVVAGYAVRYILGELAGDDIDAGFILGQLREMLPALDPSVRAGFQRAGIPVDEAALDHAEKVNDVRGFWEQCRSGEEDDGVVLALACGPLLVDRTVCPGEIGTTWELVWAEARKWVAAQVSLIEADDHDAVRRLSTFTSWSRLGYEPFGISDAQVASWEEGRIRGCWAKAQSGDGRAAFLVVCHCEDESSYEHITGLPAGQAKARLQEAMNSYTAGLRRQVVTAARRKWAQHPYRELRAFTALVRDVNDHAARRDGRPLADTPWDMPPEGWHELYDRFVCEKSDH